MAITKMSNSGIATGGNLKYDNMLAGNEAFNPSAFISIATITATSGATSFTFSGIPSTYKHLQLRGRGRTLSPYGTSAFQLQFNSDTTSTNYYSHYFYTQGSSVQTSSQQVAGVQAQFACPGTNVNSSPIFGASIIDIFDYSSTTKNKTVSFFNGVSFNDTANQGLDTSSGIWASTSAITSIKVIDNSGQGFNGATTMALYGILGA